MSSTNSTAQKPRVLLLGDVQFAREQLAGLANTYNVKQITTGSRSQFLAECHANAFEGVVAIARTPGSIDLTGRFDGELIAALPASVRFVCHNGAGYDQIDVHACQERGICVSNTPGVVSDATADTAMLLVLAAIRCAWASQKALRDGRWDVGVPLGRDPAALTLGILGLGGIGSAVARRAAPFGFRRIQYHNRSGPQLASASSSPALVGAPPEYVSFDELLRTSDVLSLHVPLTAETRHYIGAAEIACMKDGVILVNTARGGVVDEAALADALVHGKVSGVGLDVFEDEPAINKALLESDRAVLLPHVGTATVDTRRRMEVLMLDNVRRAIAEGQLLTPVPEHASTS